MIEKRVTIIKIIIKEKCKNAKLGCIISKRLIINDIVL